MELSNTKQSKSRRTCRFFDFSAISDSMRAATEEIMMMYFLASALCVQNACIYTARGDRSQTLPQRTEGRPGVGSFPGRKTAWSSLEIFSPPPLPARAAYVAAYGSPGPQFCACALFPGNQCTFEHFPFTFPVILRSTCRHITLGMASQLVLERDEFTAVVQYGLRRIWNGKTHNN